MANIQLKDSEVFDKIRFVIKEHFEAMAHKIQSVQYRCDETLTRQSSEYNALISEIDLLESKKSHCITQRYGISSSLGHLKEDEHHKRSSLQNQLSSLESEINYIESEISQKRSKADEVNNKIYITQSTLHSVQSLSSKFHYVSEDITTQNSRSLQSIKEKILNYESVKTPSTIQMSKSKENFFSRKKATSSNSTERDIIALKKSEFVFIKERKNRYKITNSKEESLLTFSIRVSQSKASILSISTILKEDTLKKIDIELKKYLKNMDIQTLTMWVNNNENIMKYFANFENDKNLNGFEVSIKI